jgi:hypothetical protein
MSEALLEIVARIKKKFLIVIDEFDKSSQIFQEVHFSRFRTYIQEPSRYATSLILISRKNLPTIELNAFNGSKLSFTLEHKSLHGFNKEELKVFVERLNNSEVKADEETLKLLYFICGNHPKMLTMFGQEMISSKGKSLRTIYLSLSDDVHRFYDGIINFTKDEYKYKKNKTDKKNISIFDKLVQLYIGPKIDLQKDDIKDLVSLGFIYELNEPLKKGEIYQTVSKDFIEYLELRAVSTQEQLWPELIQFQRLIRKIIVDKFDGDDKYPGNLIRINKGKNLINPATLETYEQKKKYTGKKDNCLICRLSFTEYYNIITEKNNWEKLFSSKFKSKPNKEDFKTLHNVRNDLAHDAKVLDVVERAAVNSSIKKIKSTIV